MHPWNAPLNASLPPECQFGALAQSKSIGTGGLFIYQGVLVELKACLRGTEVCLLVPWVKNGQFGQGKLKDWKAPPWNPWKDSQDVLEPPPLCGPKKFSISILDQVLWTALSLISAYVSTVDGFRQLRRTPGVSPLRKE